MVQHGAVRDVERRPARPEHPDAAVALRGGADPGYALFDMSLIKKVYFGGQELQLRFEGYNLFNKMNWRAPNTTVTSSSLRHDLGDQRLPAAVPAGGDVQVLSAWTTAWHSA